MNPVRFSVENHHFTIMIVVLLTFFGLFSIKKMPKSENPAVEPPGVSIIVVYPGATPDDIEELISSPIEEAVNGVQDVDDIYSTSGNGFSSIWVEFDFGVDIDDAYNHVAEKITSIRNDLPDNIASLEVTKWDLDAVNIIELALISESASYHDLEQQLDLLKKEIERINGIRDVEMHALPEQQVRVSINLEKMAQLAIPLDRIIGMIQSANTNIPGGKIDLGGKNFNINTSGSFENLDDIRNTRIPSGNGQTIYLKDIATIEYTDADMEHHARFNGKRAVLLTANQKKETDVFQITDRIKEKVASFEKELPPDMEIKIAFDQSESVSDFSNAFLLNLLEGIVLVGFVVWLGIGTRPSLVVILTIPTSICIAMGFVHSSGYGIQQMTIAGLVIALGMLVDNAIVICQNVNRLLALGEGLKEAAIHGASQLGASVASGTATTCIAFMPILLMKDVTGQYVRSMPLTVIFTLLASLLLALIFAPYLCSRLLKTEQAARKGKFQVWIEKFVETTYRNVLKKALNKPGLIIILAIAGFFISLGFIPLIGVSMFPKADKPMFFIDISTPSGSSLETTNKVIRRVEDILLNKEYLQHYVSNIGGDNPRLYYNVIPQQSKSNVGQIYVQIKKDFKQDIPQIIEQLRSEFKEIPGAKVELKQLEQGHPNDAPIAFVVIGKDIERIKQLSQQVEKMFHNTEGLINIRNPMDSEKTDLRFRINRDKAAMLGLTLADINMTIRICLSGYAVSSFRDTDGELYDIVVRLPIKESPKLQDFDRIYITSPTGASIPLKQIATIEFDSSPVTIYHYQLERSNTIMADVLPGFSIDKKANELIKKLDDLDWPTGYYYHVSGEKEAQGESFGGLGANFIIALIGMFAVLILQFKSFRQPFIIFTTIPLAIIGAILALLATGNSFSFTAMIGLTSLAGIVVNNAIILVDYANVLRRGGMDIVSAIQVSSETRFMPILLTAMTTISGLLPLTIFGGTMWGPMGWAIIGGLTTSTFLTLLVTPVLYKVYTREEKE